jgi:hypothetical protein
MITMILMKLIADSRLLPQKKYRYSDFTFIILKEYLPGKLDVLMENFYKPLGANTMYNPLQRIAKERIAPTEIDSYFVIRLYKDMFMIWSCNGRWNWRTCRNFFK